MDIGDCLGSEGRKWEERSGGRGDVNGPGPAVPSPETKELLWFWNLLQGIFQLTATSALPFWFAGTFQGTTQVVTTPLSPLFLSGTTSSQ